MIGLKRDISLNKVNNQDLKFEESLSFNRLGKLEYNTTPKEEERINNIVSHMNAQYQEYVQSAINTKVIFENLLDELKNICGCLRNSIEETGMNPSQAFFEIDPDRSVGILSILWHNVSFTTRNNTKPQALKRENGPMLFTGRIIALNGDFQDSSLELQDQEYPDILRNELASMYIPADKNQHVIIKIKHIPDKEYCLSMEEAPREFLLRVIEIICGGGIYHEVDPDIEED